MAGELAAAVRNITNTRCFLPHGVRSVASNLRPVGCSALGCSLPNIFVMQILTRECTARAMFLRRSNVIFMEILCTVPKSPWSLTGECIKGLDVSYVLRLKCQ